MQTDQAVTSYRYDQANQLLAAGDVQYTYDANGNTIARTDGQEKVEYRYDEENRLVEIRYPDGTWTKYGYDGYGRRVRKEESYWQNSNQQKVEVTQYLYDGLTVLMEFAGQDAPLAEYYRSNGQIVMKKMFGYKGRKGHGNEDLLRTRGGFIYYHYDGLGNVVDLTDQLGENIDKYYYDAFGGFFAGILEPYNSYGLTGKEYDQKAGLYYFGARWYAPEAGRWMTQDAYKGLIAIPRSLHRYMYVYNNPLNYLDRFGFSSEQGDSLRDITNEINNMLEEHLRESSPYKDSAWRDFWWANQVREKGPWDIKQPETWTKETGLPVGSEYLYNGVVVDRADIGNFHYGYIGASLGYDAVTLLEAGGMVQQLTGTSRPEWDAYPTFGDDPRDSAFILWGYEEYQQSGKCGEGRN